MTCPEKDLRFDIKIELQYYENRVTQYVPVEAELLRIIIAGEESSAPASVRVSRRPLLPGFADCLSAAGRTPGGDKRRFGG